jgi:leucyl-tRNA synthetase
MSKYNPAKIETKWQKYWETKKLYVAKDKVPGRAGKDKDNFYFLVEFPYPSGNLHVGHWDRYAVTDILARYLRMKGKNVTYPIGFDAFGLPAENAAIKNNLQPADWTKKNVAYMTKQLRSIGASFDWSREVKTTDPAYYKWTQWIFLQLYKKGLAYRAKTLVNWCPKDKTVLANEQVNDGKCDRCGTEVVQRELSQWMFKITDYADRLIDDLEKVDWPEVAKTAQINWIGRSRGAEIHFLLPNSEDTIKVFTTRADTLYGATYVVLAPEHPLVEKLTKNDRLDVVSRYLEEVRKKSELERTSLEKEKTGVFSGAYAVNPVNGERIPVWIADYVLGHYGTGAVMAVPAHDERDFEFAKKYELPVKAVVKPTSEWDFEKAAFVEDGVLVDSDDFTGYGSADAREEIVEKLAIKKLAHRKTNFKLHDWVLSRQRYWGVPIPMVHCKNCGYQPVSEKDLPVELPKLEDYKPSSDGRSPLAKATTWLKAKCPVCQKEGDRETDTMDTFVDSSWYFLRYADPKNKKVFASQEKMNSWLPVDMYVGGSEHNTMHLLYSRFFTKALYDLKLIDFDEPFTVRRNGGFILGPNGQKMSKSKGNVIDPDEQVKKYGADAVRMYLAFMGPYELGGTWQLGGINGVSRFLNRVWNIFAENKKSISKPSDSDKTALEIFLHRTIKKVGEDIENLRFNTVVSDMMKLLNEIENHTNKGFNFDLKNQKLLLKLLAPVAPHLAEEIWMSVLKNKKSIHVEIWPEYNPKLIVETSVSLVVQINGKTRGVVILPAGNNEEQAKTAALNDENVKKHLEGKEIKKVIFVKDRLISFVV